MAVKRSISYKFSFSILSIVVIIMITMLYSNYNASREIVLENAARDVKNLTQSSINQINNVFENIEKVPEDFSLLLEDPDVDRTDAKKSLKAIIERFKLLYGTAVAYEPVIDGNDTSFHAPYMYRRGDSIIFKNLSHSDYKYYKQDWYAIPKKLQKAVWSEPYFDTGGGDRLMVTYSVPFYNTINGERVFAGVITADLSLRHLQQLIESIQFYENGYAMLISQTGMVVTHRDINYREIDTVVNIRQWIKDEKLLEIIGRMTRGEKDFVSMEGIVVDNTIVRDWISFAPVPSTGWSVAILFDEKDIYSGLNKLMKKLIIMGVGGLLALAFVILATARRVTAPLKVLAKATKEIGGGNLDKELPVINTNDEVAEMGSSIKSMQEDLKSYIENLKKTTAEKEQIESEIKIASQIQRSMLPQESLDPASVNNFEINGFLHPAKEVGGDFYDYILVGDRLYFSVGDVSGKGVAAALFMAKAITLFRAKAEKGLEVNRIAFEMNNDLGKYNENAMFVTFFIGAMDYHSGMLEYTNAGHNPPYYQVNKNRLETMKIASGLPLGMIPGGEYKKESLEFKDSSRLVMFTDGITEAEDSELLLFGEERLKELLMLHHNADNLDLINLLVDEVKQFAGEADQSDDITLLILSKQRSSSS